MFDYSSKLPEAGRDINYELCNSLGYRSDEFTKEHNGKHVLFAGCSNSYGMSVGNLKDTWTWQVFEYLSQKEKMSGYYNLASCGASPAGIISRVFRYIQEYGMPELIIIIFPDLHRSLRPSGETSFGDVQGYGQNSSADYQHILYFHEQYKMLEYMCKVQGSRLITTTYDTPFTHNIMKSFNSNSYFYFDLPLSDVQYVERGRRLMEINVDEGLELLGDDGIHPGPAWQKLAAEIIIGKIVYN